MTSIKVQPSRFALLKVEDDDSDDGQSKTNQSNKHNQQKNAQKRKNKKKRQQQSGAEAQELKHLAFGLPNRQRVQSGSDHGHTNGSHGGEAPKKQWDEWQKMDQEYAQDAFEKDLQQAMLLSKLDNEQDKQKKSSVPATTQSDRGGGDTKETKKKKKKDKPHAMSLEQFNNPDDKKTDEADDVNPSSPITKLPSGSADPKFFDSVENDVSRILRQEKMQEEYKKQYAAESVITAKYQEQINKMEKEVQFLRATMKKQEEELKQVKKRNKQLCVILAQGEMKDKAEVLMQVDQLTGVKDELTDQVAELTADLEKERSKVHSFKSELDKIKGGKHK